MVINVSARFVMMAFCGIGLAALCGRLGASDQAASPEATPPWQKPYTGQAATGSEAIALWHLDGRTPAADSSGHGHDLALRGQARFVDSGRFGGCLESFPASSSNDTAQGAAARNDPDLSPKAAFTLEMWLKPKPEMSQSSTVFLLDKKYYHYAKDLPQANHDYCLYLRHVSENQWRITAYLGYGTDSAAYSSRVVELVSEQWYHVAFTYDGAGTGRFFLNGHSIGRTVHEGRTAISPGSYDLVLGDRYGSTHAGCAAFLDEIRISRGVVPFFTGTLELDTSHARTAFVRMEQEAAVFVKLFNDTGRTLSRLRISAKFGQNSQSWSIPQLEKDRSHPLAIPVDTALRPGDYPLVLKATGIDHEKRVKAECRLTVTIVPRPLPNQMPVVMWGGGDLDTLEEVGFTHHLVSLVDYARIWNDGKPTESVEPDRMAESTQLLDEHLRRGIGAITSLSPGRWVVTDTAGKQTFERIDRAGKPYARENVCARFPEVQTFAYNVGASVAQTFGSFPALQAALIHTEIRDSTNLCFHEHDRQAFRQFAGYDIPDAAVSPSGVRYSKLEDFPADRVVADDDPILTFYRWFWKQGDGWNALHTRVHAGLKSTGRKNLWTFFDPAVRVPSVWGSGGGVDVISQWTYSYPDPIKIGQAADELFAMAGGASQAQKVMKMTQIIWYRSQTAPELPDDVSQRAQWEHDIPDARFITIAPDHLREAFWSKIARAVQGIMYHGWGSLVPASHTGYRFTNPQTRPVLTELIHNVVRPLGPTLLQVPDRKADVALLESFASQVFAGRGTRGWGGSWEADMHLILQWAQIQPRIVYDETILRDELKSVRVLVLPACDVLTEGVVRQVKAFQAHGGTVVGDEFLCPAIQPDFVIPSRRRSGKADQNKAALQTKAAQLRQQLDPIYQRYTDSSNPDIVVRCRQYGSSDYLFALNDRRTFGTYVGHHGLVMERGLPASATLTVRRAAGYVYDLVAGKPITATPNGSNRLTFDADFGPADGRVFLIASEPIAGIRLDVPDRAARGDRITLRVVVVDAKGRPLDAVVPVKIDIVDASGSPAEFSGYYGATNGAVAISLAIASNDPTGVWTLRATELASGKSQHHALSVQ